MSTVPNREDVFQYETSMFPLALRVSESFEEFVRKNPDLVVEQNASGEIVVMPPTGGETSILNAELNFQLQAWSKQHGGFTFESAVVFCLPDGSKRSPYASWISSNRWKTLSKEDRATFPPISPDFVIELRSKSDTLKELKAKMASYMENGVRLGWLIDPYQFKVHIYEPGKPVEVLSNPESVSNDKVLPGFLLDLRTIWKTSGN